MGHDDNNFSSPIVWILSLVRQSTESTLSIHAPEDMAMLLNLVTANPDSEATSKAFDAVSQWTTNNFPQWDIINIVPQHGI